MFLPSQCRQNAVSMLCPQVANVHLVLSAEVVGVLYAPKKEFKLYTNEQCITLHKITSHYITLHCIILYYITLHYITLHYITLHYITL